VNKDVVIPLMNTVIGGVITVVATVITSRTQVQIATVTASTKKRQGRGVTDTPAIEPHTLPLTKQRNLILAALACGVLLLVWGVYSLNEIHTLRNLIQSKEDQFQHLRASFEKVEGITFNPIDVKAEYRVVPDTRDYTFWIEASDDVLDRIDHVKYVFNDKSWKADSVLTSHERKSESGRAFELKLWSWDSLKYITVLVMYDAYKENGNIQPINFKWRSEEVEVK